MPTLAVRSPSPPGTARRSPRGIAVCAVLVIATGLPWLLPAVAPEDPPEPAVDRTAAPIAEPAFSGREILVAGYAGLPYYYRSNVRLEQPNGTKLLLKRLGWDGDAFYFPIDGGIRSVEWRGNTGLMIDFLHNKAIARLGRGSHGRKLTNPVIEDVETEGTIAGTPAPSPLKLTELFERFEFTHGHNMLFLTPLLRLPSLAPGLTPYVGVGGGFALPHVEVWSPNAGREHRTNEYQLAGPAVQLVAGLDLRLGRWSYFIEYKFSYAWIAGALTGDHSWMNFNMPGDLWRQFGRWWRGEPPKYGRFWTRLGAHQVVIGGGYWLRKTAPRP